MTNAVVAGIVLAGLLLAGCTGRDGESPSPSASPSSTPSADASSPVPVPKPPREGSCHRLTFDEAVAPTADHDAVKCRRKHTSQTFRVGRLALGAGDDRRTVDSDRAQRQAARACTGQLGRFLGADREALRLSLLATVWFTPTVEEGEAGGRWFRCDVIATAGSRRLLPLPRRIQGALDDFALCATSEPGHPDSRRIPCSQPHTWEALTTVDLPGTAYPSADRAADTMADTCRASARSAADDPLDFTWSEERPTRAQWKSGQRYGICWVPE